MNFFKSNILKFGKTKTNIHTPSVQRFRSLPPNLSNGLAKKGAKILLNRYDYAGTEKALTPPFWSDIAHEKNDEWRRAVYGFVWLDDLAAHGGEQTALKAREILNSWLDLHEKMSVDDFLSDFKHNKDGAERLRFDIMATRHTRLLRRAFLIFSHGPPEDLRPRLLAYLAKEAAILTHVSLMEDKLDYVPFIRCLIAGLLSALCVDGFENRITPLLNRLISELNAFILPDGMVANRALNDLARLLFDLVGLRLAFEHSKTPFDPSISTKIEKMASALRMLRHGDGMLALYHGTRDGRNDIIDAALEHANSMIKTPNLLPLGGYGVIKKNKYCAFMDFGAPPKKPSYCSVSHAAPLAIELSHSGTRLITNCGGVVTKHEELKRVSRHAAAHSTIIINNTDPINLKSLGTEPHKALNIQHERIEQNGEVWLSAWHDGYKQNYQSIVKRQLYMNESGESLLGEDFISAANGVYPFHIRFHLHPQIQIEAQDTPNLFRFYLQNGKTWWFEVDGATAELASSVYLAGTKPIISTHQLVLSGHTGDQDIFVNWVLEYDVSCDIV